MQALEREVEDDFKHLIKQLGGISYKWISPGCRGVPDRLVFIAGQTYAVELKRRKGIRSPIQKRIHQELISHGVTVCIVYGKYGVHRLGGFLYERKLHATRNSQYQGIESQTSEIKIFR